MSRDFKWPYGTQSRSGCTFRHCQFVLNLKVHPTLRVRIEVPGQSQCGFSCNPSAATYYFVYPGWRYADGLCQRARRQSIWFHKVIFKYFAGMYRIQPRHSQIILSVVVNNLHFICVSIIIPETIDKRQIVCFQFLHRDKWNAISVFLTRNQAFSIRWPMPFKLTQPIDLDITAHGL